MATLAGDADQQRQVTTEAAIGLDRRHHPGDGDDVADPDDVRLVPAADHPDRTFPDACTMAQSTTEGQWKQPDRHHRSAQWFARTRRGGGAILHHRHIRPVLIREWSPKMDGIAGTIWASQTTSSTWPPRQLVT